MHIMQKRFQRSHIRTEAFSQGWFFKGLKIHLRNDRHPIYIMPYLKTYQCYRNLKKKRNSKRKSDKNGSKECNLLNTLFYETSRQIFESETFIEMNRSIFWFSGPNKSITFQIVRKISIYDLQHLKLYVFHFPIHFICFHSH